MPKIDLAVIVPSRGRPEAIAELAEVWRETTTTTNAHLAVCIDDNDPKRLEYGKNVNVYPSRTMVEALNRAAAAFADMAYAVGFMGDDHRPRTVGWDARYLEALHELGTGIVYGNDLLQGRNLPTQCAMTSDIIRSLGYMAPPGLRHMYVDNFWLALGRSAGCIKYLPDVVIEHMHPIAGKAEWTEGHVRVNAREMYEHDLATYARIRDHGELADAVAKVKALRA